MFMDIMIVNTSVTTFSLLILIKDLSQVSNNNNNISFYKAPKALASEALAAGQPWVLIKSLRAEVRLKTRLKYRQRLSADY